jgi:hypothetical protein
MEIKKEFFRFSRIPGLRPHRLPPRQSYSLESMISLYTNWACIHGSGGGGGGLARDLTAVKPAAAASSAAARHVDAAGNPSRSTSCAPNSCPRSSGPS